MDKFRVAVTGGSGYIGQRIVRQLCELGHTVFNVDLNAPADPFGTHVLADLRQRLQVQAVLEQVDAVCHLAEIPNGPTPLSPEEHFIHNLTVGATVLKTAADLKLRRVIYTSSCQVYGCWGNSVFPPQCLPLDETHPYQPSNVYACAKVANELFTKMLAHTQGLSAAIFRLPAVWRHNEETGSQLGWFDGMTEGSDGCATYVGLDDVAQAYALALEHPRPGCEAYHFSAVDVLSTLPLSELIEKHYPGYPKLPANWPARKSPMNCNKAKEHFGWTPEFSALESFRKHFGRDPHPAVV